MEAATLKHGNDNRQKNGTGIGGPFFKPLIQPKLSINEPGDHFEHEADAMADKVMRMTDIPANQNSFFKPANNIVQRKCKACEEEEKHVHRKESNTGTVEGSNALQGYVSSLSSSGQSMSATSRSFFEPRFGHDFSNVRLHTDAVAAKSAQSINALAYTTGNNIVFNSGQYSPDSDSGKRLIAHELTHVVQQGGSVGRKIQRQVAATDPDPSSVSSCKIHFVQGSTEFVDAKEFDTCKEQIRTYLKSNPDGHVVLHGYASEEGDATFNMDLSRRREETVLNLLKQAKIDTSRVTAQPHGKDTTYGTKPENRRVEVVMSRSVTFDPDQINVKPPAPPSPFVCGPDITARLEEAVKRTRTQFGSWTDDEKVEACDSLDSLTTGAMAWDIIDLHNNAWILTYRPACATEHATPACGSSVQIGNGCHYAGSANYVIFGVMCKLCADHFLKNGPINTGYARFTQASMMHLIDLYKGHGFTGFATPSANFHASEMWSYAGYMGWPAVGGPASPDRANCATTCPSPFVGAAFTVHWEPKIF